MNRREASKEETRELILNAARNLFWEKGVDGCTMRNIALEAGVSPASVVVHFKNKTALLEATLHDDIDRTIADAFASLPPDAVMFDRLMYIPRAMFAFYDTNRPLYRSLLSNTLLEPEEDNPHLTKQLQQYLKMLSCIVENEKKQGNVRSDIDVYITATSLASLYIGVLISFYRSPQITPRTAVEMLSAMTQQFLDGLMISEVNS